jgi:hypothetical protein
MLKTGIKQLTCDVRDCESYINMDSDSHAHSVGTKYNWFVGKTKHICNDCLKPIGEE